MCELTMYIVTSPSAKKPEKYLSVKNVGRGIWKIVRTSFSKNSSYAPVFYRWRVLLFIIILETRVISLPWS